MDHGMIGKIEKAKRYAEQPERFQFHTFELTFRGDNNDHVVKYERGSWSCDCEFFTLRGVCSHTMALERLLEPMMAPKVPA
ncbi:MAG: hypothetical protein ABSB61_09440 [Anaerolineales bacterium]|jgi:hypothetical protein